MNTEELRHLVDEVAASATNWHLLAMQLQRPPGGPNDPIPALVGAFYYMLYPIQIRERDECPSMGSRAMGVLVLMKPR